MSDALDLLIWITVIIGPYVGYRVWRLTDDNVKRHQREMKRKRYEKTKRTG